MLVGAHVKTSGGLATGLTRGEEMEAEAIQIFTQSPRMWRPTNHSAESLAAYAPTQAAGAHVRATFCHATYLINLATSNAELFDKSEECLLANLLVAGAIGSSGLVLHVGSHGGAGLEAVREQVAASLVRVLEAAEERLGANPTPILLENAAGTGGTVGRTFEELAAIIAAASGDRRLGVCLDTQHLFASGVSYADRDESDAVIADLEAVIGLERLRCIHLNDSKVALGANRDRHENLGQGAIGAEALGWLISSPRLEHVACLLEVPGDGDGPRHSDVETAKAILADGRARRAA